MLSKGIAVVQGREDVELVNAARFAGSRPAGGLGVGAGDTKGAWRRAGVSICVLVNVCLEPRRKVAWPCVYL